jgi:hypothetical protein
VGSLSTGVNSLSVALNNTVQYDDPDHKSVTLGTLGTPVTLKNIAPGAVNENSVEAINGSQLFATAQSAADALGGGSSVDADGKITKPTYKFTDNSTFNNVGDALANLDGRVTQNTSDISIINTTLSTINNGGGISTSTPTRPWWIRPRPASTRWQSAAMRSRPQIMPSRSAPVRVRVVPTLSPLVQKARNARSRTSRRVRKTPMRSTFLS